MLFKPNCNYYLYVFNTLVIFFYILLEQLNCKKKQNNNTYLQNIFKPYTKYKLI